MRTALRYHDAAIDHEFGDDRPLDEERLRRLEVNCADLVDLISLKDGLLDDMMAVGCVTHQQRDAVREINVSSADRNRKLIDILTRRSVAHFNSFLACLQRNGQAHVANFLAYDGGKTAVLAPVSYTHLTLPTIYSV